MMWGVPAMKRILSVLTVIVLLFSLVFSTGSTLAESGTRTLHTLNCEMSAAPNLKDCRISLDIQKGDSPWYIVDIWYKSVQLLHFEYWPDDTNHMAMIRSSLTGDVILGFRLNDQSESSNSDIIPETLSESQALVLPDYSETQVDPTADTSVTWSEQLADLMEAISDPVSLKNAVILSTSLVNGEIHSKDGNISCFLPLTWQDLQYLPQVLTSTLDINFDSQWLEILTDVFLPSLIAYATANLPNDVLDVNVEMSDNIFAISWGKENKPVDFSFTHTSIEMSGRSLPKPMRGDVTIVGDATDEQKTKLLTEFLANFLKLASQLSTVFPNSWLNQVFSQLNNS